MTCEDGQKIDLLKQDVAIRKDIPTEPVILKEIVYQEEGIARFPSLDGLPIKANFSWGRTMGNMQELVESSPLVARERTYDFLRRAGMAFPPRAVCFSPAIKNSPEIAVITQGSLDHLNSKIDAVPGEKHPDVAELGSNLMYTKMKDMTFMIKPGDCAVAVLYVPSDRGNVLGVAHWGRDQLDKRLAEKAINHLSKQGFDPSSIKVAIAPGLGPKNHYIQEADLGKHIRDLWKWVDYVWFEEFEDERRYHLDLLGYLLAQLSDAGVTGENIEAYGVDTFEAAKNGDAYSYRYSVATGQPNRNGRMIIAAQLK